MNKKINVYEENQANVLCQSIPALNDMPYCKKLAWRASLSYSILASQSG